MKKKFTFLANLFILLALITTPLVVEGQFYKRVAAVADIADGDNVIFVNQAETYACGTTQNTNNRTPVAISVTNHIYTYDSHDNVQVFTAKKNNSGKYGFHTGSGYIYSASSTKNYLKTNNTSISTAPSGQSAWSLSVSSNVFTCQNVQNTDYYLAFNGTSYFSQYSNGQSKPYIYKIAYSVIYNGNGSTSGSVPTDPESPYLKGKIVTVKGNTGLLVKTGYSFDGWNTKADGSGTQYAADATINNISENTTLYAQWALAGPTLSVDPEEADPFTYSHGNGPSESQPFELSGSNLSSDIIVSVSSTNNVFEISDDDKTFGTTNLTLDDGDIFTVHLKSGLNIGSYSGTVTISSTDADDVDIALSGSVTGYTVTYNGNGSDGGSVPTDNNAYSYNASVTVLENTGLLEKTGHDFGGWNTMDTGAGITYIPGSPTQGNFNITANTTLYAIWTVNNYGYTLNTTGETTHATAKLQKYVSSTWTDVEEEEEIPYNTLLKVVTTPDDGYDCIVTVIDNDDNTIELNANNEFRMPASAITVTVNVVEIHTITKAEGLSNGDVSFSPSSAAPGEQITVTATPAIGYVLDEWNVYKYGEPATKVVVEDGKFIMPAYNVVVGATFRLPLTMTVDFESATSAYTNWVFSNITAQENTISAHGGSECYGKTNGTTTAYIQTKYIIANPLSITCYISKVGTNTNASSYWYIQYSSDGETWNNVGDSQAAANGITAGIWTEITRDLSLYSNVYIRVYYGGTNAVRAIDDISLSYAPAPKYNMSVISTDNLAITATANATVVGQGSSSSVEQGTIVTLACTPDENYRLDEWSVYRTTNPATTVSVSEGGTFTMPAYAVTITATSAPVRTLTLSVNGATSSAVYDKDDDVDLSAPVSGIPAGYEFVGWTANPANTTDSDLITSVNMDNNKTVYAVIKKANKITLTGDDFDGAYDKTEVTAEMQGMSFGRYYVCKATGIQFNKDYSGYFYNKDAFTNLVSIVATWTLGSAIDFKVGSSEKPSSATALTTPTPVEGVYTYNIPTGNDFVYIQNNTGGNVKYSSIVFNMSGDETRYTRVYTETTTTASDDITITGKTIIPSGSTLNMNGHKLNNTNAANLIIEDGGELILSNSNTDVEATVKKTVTASSSSKTATNNWYAISSPTHDDGQYYESFSNVSNLTPAAPDYLYNVYRYDEYSVVWQEHRDENNEFNTMKKGRGYLFRSTKGGDLEYAGVVNTNTVEYNLSWSCPTEKFKGFNLIGNPYTHTIYKGAEGSAIPNGSILEDKYYTIGTNGRLTLTADGTAIAPGQAIFVQAKSASPLTMNNSTSGKVRDKYANDNIWFMVKNAESSDLACVEFRKGHGLNKVEHRNDITPMLYIMHNGENFASADMSDNTSVINLGFEAKTTGEYTFSLKATGTYSYMHLIDKITGADVDMLIEDNYSFVGSPRDRKDRFELRLNYNAANIDSESDIFAYQNGTDIIVRGEGELQVFDVTGRMAMKQQINGVQTVNGLNNGVYIFRLVGTEVKTQKIVVR